MQSMSDEEFEAALQEGHPKTSPAQRQIWRDNIESGVEITVSGWHSICERLMDDLDAAQLNRYQSDVLRSAEANHIWLNAMHCIRPSPQFLQDLGTRILRMLDSKGNVIQADFDDGPFKDLETPVLILRINKS